MFFANCEPISFEEPIGPIRNRRWKDGMNDEKKNAKGEVETHKAKLVAKCYKQHQGIHYMNKKSVITLSKNLVFHD